MRYLLLLLCCFGLSSLHAQNKIIQYQNVYLDGGSFLRASTIDTIDGYLLRATLSQYGGVVTVPLISVTYVEQENRRQLLLANGQTVIAGGRYNTISTQYLTGEREYDRGYRSNISVTYSKGKYFYPYLAAGLGISVDFYESITVPIFAEGRYFPFHRSTTPYVGLQAGYGIAAEKIVNQDEFERTRGGLMWQPELGVRLATKRGADIQMSVGYKFQHYRVKYNYPDDSYYTSFSEKRQFRSVSFRFGFIF